MSDSINLIIQIAMLGVIITVITQVLESAGFPQYKMPISIIGIISIMVIVAVKLSAFFSQIKTMFYF